MTHTCLKNYLQSLDLGILVHQGNEENNVTEEGLFVI